MISIDKLQIYEELKMIKETLYTPFPYSDTTKIQKDFKMEFQGEDNLTGDLNVYWMNIAGSLSYVQRAKVIPKNQVKWLGLSFFDIFPQYRFFEESIAGYPLFYDQYINYEKARKLLIDYLSYNDFTIEN